jgi:hypothetical protein
MTSTELWHRSWSGLDLSGKHYVLLAKEDVEHIGQGPIWLCTDAPSGPIVDGRPYAGRPDNTLEDGRRIFVMPIPLRVVSGMKVRTALGSPHLVFPAIPDRPQGPATNENPEAKALLDRVKSVWDRLREVETSLADPALVWQTLSELWLKENTAADPEMDIIVRQARHLSSTLAMLDRAPRRILRRTQRMIPLSRVQEIDRKA